MAKQSNTTKPTTKQVRKHIPNPTGKGGFQERPEDRSDGRWKSEDSISFQYNKLLRLKESEFKDWQKKHPEGERTVAQVIAYSAVVKARKDLPYLKEITDRTEGKSPQSVDLTSGGNELKTIGVQVMDMKHEDKPEAKSDKKRSQKR